MLRSTWPDKSDDYVATIAGLDAARIMLEPRAGSALVWCWYMTGPYLPPHLAPVSGTADTLNEAKAAVRVKFDRWLAWALEQQGPVTWHGRRGVSR